MIKRFLKGLMHLAVSKKLRQFEIDTADPLAAQRRRFADIIYANENTEFGREYSFSSISTIDDYRTRVPIRRYNDFVPYIERIFKGEKNILTAADVSMFGVTSGTSAEAKYIPLTRPFTLEHHASHLVWMFNMIAARDEGVVGQIFSMVSPAVQGYTPAGVPYGSSSGKQYREQSVPIRMLHPVPYDVCRISDSEAKYYVTLAFALKADLRVVNSVNPSTLVMLAGMLKDWSEPLLEDIKTGKLHNAPGLTAEETALYNRLFKADALRSGRLREVLKCEGSLTPAGAWANLRAINTWQGGNAPFYLGKVKELWGDVPQRCLGLRATEGTFSIPLEDHSPSGVIAVGGHFMEFVPDDGHQEISEDSPTLLAHELETGKKYRLIITTSSGLYRYDLGDIVEVTGMRANTPEIAFLHKAGGVLSVTGEKVYADQAVMAMAEASGKISFTVADFTLTYAIHEGAVSYKLYLELAAEQKDEEIRELVSLFDAELQRINLEYREKRDSGRLRKPFAVILKKGSYDNYRNRLVVQGKPDGQIKPLHIFRPEYNNGIFEYSGVFFDSVEVLRRVY